MPIQSDPESHEPDINDLAAELKDLAAERRLTIVPTMPLPGNAGFVALLDQDDMTASDFCDLAVAAGASIMYVQADSFDAESDLTIDRRPALGWQTTEESAELASLRQKASAYNGQIGELALGFAVSGVLHSWIATASWYDEFLGRLQELESQTDPRFGQMPEAQERKLIERLSNELAAIPEFRSASTAAQRRRVAQTQTEVAALQSDSRPGYRSAVFRAIHEAGEKIAAESDARYKEIENDLAGLAAECETTPSFRNAGSARARRERARDFLTEKAGGYSPPTRLLELFLDTPPLQSIRTGRH